MEECTTIYTTTQDIHTTLPLDGVCYEIIILDPMVFIPMVIVGIIVGGFLWLSS